MNTVNKFYGVYQPYYGFIGGNTVVTDEDGDTVVKGFATYADAETYAKNRTSSQRKTCFVMEAISQITFPLVDLEVVTLVAANDNPSPVTSDGTDVVDVVRAEAA